jgi:Cu/Zn superoxide dismutase
VRHQVLCGLFTTALIVGAAGSAFAMAPFAATINSAQETPPNGSTATGLGRVIVDTSTHTLFYYFEFSGLSAPETAAHIHGYVPPGTPGGVVNPLPLGSPKIGSWAYPIAHEQEILDGLTYVNIHSTAFPGGEIRGQIVVDPNTNMVAVLQPGQETPPTASSGQGIGFFVINPTAFTLASDIHFGNLTSAETAAHIHGYVPPGTPGGVVHPLPLGNPIADVWNYPPADTPNILGGLAYANIHTTMFGGGEIRGQILQVSPVTDAPSIPTRSSVMSLVAAPNPVHLNGGNVALFYAIPKAGDVDVTIHDVAGRLVKTVHHGRAEANGIFAWDTRDEHGSPVAAGVYFARLRTADRQETRSITVLK